ncbi:Aerobic cobaltochelatase subunit CobN [Austwickia sp. TVS 96-490-7B]|uniref:cobaltochelatase subunit CobN n=1 Tax=Austwickia sp. TVS 96-490-7B TaxID=2830843 RepID=UPI001C5862AE|nr:cobaltochelatase subunit CobN [Austwickia sp. TVS 96-490-7B]MBW3085965.1 Aerobic cobaltochelatase subunit CobN [Austwickia sp. TVS 96-490-7B]
MTRIALLSTSDTDLLSARASGADYVYANPTRPGPDPERPAHSAMKEVWEAADVVVVRILGGPQDLCEGFRALRVRPGTRMIVLGGEQTPDAALMELSTVPAGVVAEAHRYLAYGGPDNLRELHAFLSDTLLLTGEGFAPPTAPPVWGVLDRPAPGPVPPEVVDRTGCPTRPRIGILFYRAQYTAGNHTYVQALADAVDDAGGRGVPIFVTSLRGASADLLAHLGEYDALITTVLAAGGTAPATAQAGGDDEGWDVRALAALDVPVIQAMCLTWDRGSWEGADDGMSPLDVASQVAVPEFDGRIISVAFSFKEIDSEGLPRYVADPERCARVAGIALGYARLRHVPPAQRRIAVVLSAYPTKHSRIGNAVGLDTPVSLVRLLRAMRDAGYDVGAPGEIPGLDESAYAEPVPKDQEPVDPDTRAGNDLIHALISAGGQDEDWLTSDQLAGQPVRIDATTYRQWFAELPEELRADVVQAWGQAPGDLFVDRSPAALAADPDGQIVSATLRAGNVVVLVQPPRGFGENPIAIYHDPDLAPTHHYLATYRWIEEAFGAHAVVHVGKHGNLEWLPGKTLALSPSCGPDAALGNTPVIYPFLVNDPGEGAQAKRRAHATIVDHLVPPMARAESYGDIARLEQLLDEYGNVSVMDPAKAPALRAQIWTLIQAAKLHQDLGVQDMSVEDAEAFDEFVMHIDGWLCEVKDAQIRDGLHILGAAPRGEALVNLVLSILRARQVFTGGSEPVPGLRTALGLDEAVPSNVEHRLDHIEEFSRSLITGLAERDWDDSDLTGFVCAALERAQAADPALGQAVVGADTAAVAASLRFACREVVPRLVQTCGEIDAVLHALDGGYIPAGPSGSPLRGLVNVLPTGRNFYTVDPKAIPSRLAWDTGSALADDLCARHLRETGSYPRSVGLSVWGTSAMRTSGDDVAEVLALLGVRPVWDEASRRVTRLEVVPVAELGRPRVDVTVRISGFFRDAFPHVIALLDDAVHLVAGLDEAPEDNYVRAHVEADLAAPGSHGDRRRATTRIFGSKPGTYGAGILQLVESGTWRDDADIAEVYATWGGYAYGRDLDGVPARGDMETAFRRIQVAAKNIDTREHDIADSDDYFQYHGGMVATVRALTGSEPAAYVGDSTTPEAVRTRSLSEETARVFRSRVVNPRWLSAMRRHGYKGAFEMAATVDYLFGFDATAGVVQDWMYESLAQEYVLDETNQEFLRDANPWALHSMVERLHEAAERGLWEEPDPAVMDQLRQVFLEVEGDLEDGVGR